MPPAQPDVAGRRQPHRLLPRMAAVPGHPVGIERGPHPLLVAARVVVDLVAGHVQLGGDAAGGKQPGKLGHLQGVPPRRELARVDQPQRRARRRRAAGGRARRPASAAAARICRRPRGCCPRGSSGAPRSGTAGSARRRRSARVRRRPRASGRGRTAGHRSGTATAARRTPRSWPPPRSPRGRAAPPGRAAAPRRAWPAARRRPRAGRDPAPSSPSSRCSSNGRRTVMPGSASSGAISRLVRTGALSTRVTAQPGPGQRLGHRLQPDGRAVDQVQVDVTVDERPRGQG